MAVGLVKSVARVIVFLLIAIPARAEEPIVNIYNWTDYIDPTVLADFTRKPASGPATTSSTAWRPWKRNCSPVIRVMTWWCRATSRHFLG